MNPHHPSYNEHGPIKSVDTQELNVPDYDSQEEWHIQCLWNPKQALCGENIAGGDSLPGAEVPDEITCHKCLSIDKSVLHRFVTEPFMRFKIWLVG